MKNTNFGDDLITRNQYKLKRTGKNLKNAATQETVMSEAAILFYRAWLD